MCALVATSLAGDSKKEKRGLLPSHGLGHELHGFHQSEALLGAPLSGGPLAASPFSGALLAAPAQPAFAHGIAAPALELAQPIAHVPAIHTHSVERVPQPYPVPVDRTIVKHVPVDRLIPQPYTVIKHIPQPYPVPVERQIIKEVQVPQVSTYSKFGFEKCIFQSF